MKTFIATALTLSLLPAVASARAIHENFTQIHPDALSRMIAANATDLHIYDVNSPSIRKEYGIIPGAKEISYKDFSPSKDLPQDKSAKLVFYCANTKCTASHHTADLAMSAGYSHVYVLVDGIMGWKKAKQPVTQH